MSLKWSTEFQVGVKEMDSQHQELISEMARLVDILTTGQNPIEAGVALSNLEGQLDDHFSLEEALMSKYAYAASFRHKKAHEAYRRDFLAFKEEVVVAFSKGDPLEPVAVKIRDLLVNHIRDHDLDLGRHIREARGA